MTRDDTTDDTAEAVPSVIVSHLDIVYRIFGARRSTATTSRPDSSRLEKVLRRSRNVGATHEVHAVKDVSFVAHHGESIGIIGRNGSGKSTLLRAVAGLIPPTRGRVWVAGDPALLGVNAVLMRKLTGERNIYIGGQALGLTKQQVSERFDDIVEFSGIGDFVHLPMDSYSSGMAARLRFAISTAVAPDVLMVDEALATGDAEFKQRSSERIAEIRDQAGTVFLVSHANDTIREICGRALWMDKGQLVMDGPAEEVVSAYEDTLPKRRAKKADAREHAGATQDASVRPAMPGTRPARTGNEHPDRASEPVPSAPRAEPSRTTQPGRRGSADHSEDGERDRASRDGEVLRDPTRAVTSGSTTSGQGGS